MSYQAAGFNHKQQAIRAMSDIAAGAKPMADATASAGQASIRYAKDLLAQPVAAASAAPTTVDTASDTAAALAKPEAGAAHSSGSSDQAQSIQTPTPQVAASAAPQAEAKSVVGKDERDIAAVMWLASLMFLMIPGMLVLLNHNSSPYLKQQARESLNWTVTFVLGSIVCTVLTIVFIGAPLQILLGVAHLVFCLMGANAARKGEAFRVPMTWRPLQD